MRKEYEQKIQSIKNDAKKALETGFLSDYVRLKYHLLAKYSELLYMILYKVPLDENNELHIEDIIHKIEDKVNQSIVSIDQLHTWRIIRNDIVHEQYKVKSDELEEAKRFFREAESKFEVLLNEKN
ncbi:MAG: hypothetical protein EU521_01105 [Promethearchaeota archaeon]|nr:MAG: hypothetical protein EU521_01105 [Candidatus Lokiarchaeota archaeon]